MVGGGGGTVSGVESACWLMFGKGLGVIRMGACVCVEAIDRGERESSL